MAAAQTLAEHDDGRWRLIAPGDEVAGTLARETYGGRRAEWRHRRRSRPRYRPAHHGHPGQRRPARGSDFDLFRTRRAAARALAAWHDPDLYDQEKELHGHAHPHGRRRVLSLARARQQLAHDGTG